MDKLSERNVCHYVAGRGEFVAKNESRRQGEPPAASHFGSFRSTPLRRTFAKGDVKGFHPDGQAVEEKAMLDALKDGTKAAVLSTRALSFFTQATPDTAA